MTQSGVFINLDESNAIRAFQSTARELIKLMFRFEMTDAPPTMLQERRSIPVLYIGRVGRGQVWRNMKGFRGNPAGGPKKGE